MSEIHERPERSVTFKNVRIFSKILKEAKMSEHFRDCEVQKCQKICHVPKMSENDTKKVQKCQILPRTQMFGK